MNKTVRIILCVLAFAILCAGIVSFLEIFSPAASPILAYVDWSSCEVVSPSGSTRSLDPNTSFQNWNWSPGDTFRLRTTLPPLEDHPDWYGPTSYLLLDCAALQYDVSLDGRPLFTADFRSIDPSAAMCQLHIPLPEEDAGKTLELTFTASDAIAIQMPLVARFSGEDVRSSFSASLACEDALPAGAFALECVLIFAIFFVGLYAGQADWSLPLLAIVAFLNVATTSIPSRGTISSPTGSIPSSSASSSPSSPSPCCWCSSSSTTAGPSGATWAGPPDLRGGVRRLLRHRPHAGRQLRLQRGSQHRNGLLWLVPVRPLLPQRLPHRGLQPHRRP